MIVFGWLCLALTSALASLGSITVLLGSIGLTGKIGGECWAFLVVAAGLCYATYANFPFVVELKP